VSTQELDDVIVVVLQPGQSGADWTGRARRVLFVAPPHGRPDRFVTHPHNYFEAPLDEHRLAAFAARVLSWFRPSAVHAGGPAAEAHARCIRSALAADAAPPKVIPLPRNDERPLVLLVHKHIADVLYEEGQSLIPREIAPIYLSHARGGLNFYDLARFHQTFICDFLDPEEVRVVADWAVEQFAPDRVIALHEKYVVFAAELRARYGLPGLEPATAIRFRDKAVMKQCVSEHTALRVPRFARIKGTADFVAFADSVGPTDKVVLKPIDGLGAERTFVCRDLAEAEQCWRDMGAPTAGYEIEEFIDGGIYHVDTVVANGQPGAVSVSEYLSSPADFEAGGDFSSMALADGPVTRLLIAANEVALDALGPVSAVTHLEFFITRDGEVVFCEAAVRPGGAGISHVFGKTHGTDGVTAALLVESGLDVPPAKARGNTIYGWIGFYPDGDQAGGIGEGRGAALGIIGHEHSDFAGLGTGAPRHSCDFTDKFIVQADSPDQFRERVKRIRAEYCR
jgi:hypothetical protein